MKKAADEAVLWRVGAEPLGGGRLSKALTEETGSCARPLPGADEGAYGPGFLERAQGLPACVQNARSLKAHLLELGGEPGSRRRGGWCIR